KNDPAFGEVFKANVCSMVGEEEFAPVGHSTGSTDMGDIGHIMPALHPHVGGAIGTGHGKDYEVVDHETAILNPAKAMAMTVIDLLWDDAAKAKEILATNKPPMTKQEYLAFMSKMNKEELYQG
ncbi:MAG: amidohydrolase, partial [Candidatus Marsarchaeota archaeon]|nr:amidohydrolase [Candidatus Marsarchaeota archaeon]